MVFLRLSCFTGLMMLIATLAMTANGVAHHDGQKQVSPDLLLYLAMGGTLDELCDGADPDHRLTGTCEACLIAQNAVFSDAGSSVLRPVAADRSAHLSWASRTWNLARPDNTHRARAPPAFRTS